jgi:diamine N-acetyltransferase
MVSLRALEPEDLDFLYELENNPDIWEVSGTLVPYSRMLLAAYLKMAHKDIFEVKQLRLVICTTQGTRIGLIDLFDFEPNHKRAGIGIVIAASSDRGLGYGSEALQLLTNYCFKILGLHQIYAGVGVDNLASLSLFRNSGFAETGRRMEWIRRGNQYEDEILFQKINRDVH